jgi:hypothetical protein
MQGKELKADVPEALLGRVERVIFRVKEGPAERVPANLQTLADNRSRSAPSIMNLDNRSPVSIDPVPTMPTRQEGAGLNRETYAGNTPNYNGNLSNNGYGNIGSNSAPYSGTNDPRNSPARSIATNALTDSFNGPASQRNNNSANDYLPPAVTRENSTGSALSQFLQLNRNSGSNSQNASNTPPYSGSLTSPGYGPFPNTAGLPNNNFSTPPSQQYGQPVSTQPSYAGTPQLNPQLTQSYNPYAQPNPSFPQPHTSLAQQTGPSSTLGLTRPGANGYPPTNETLEAPTRDKVLPFLLLFSIVGNVYLGLWMSHLRTRYRELRTTMRGLPASDLH